MQQYKMLINGDWLPAADGQTFDSVNPATGEVWATVPEAGIADVNAAVDAAQNAFPGWAATSPTARGKYLRALGDLLAARSEELGRVESLDTGKIISETRWQAKYIADFFHYYAGCADKIHGDTLPIDKPDLFVFTTREPLGVVAAVVPWNSQLFLLAVKVAPALAAGNTVVLKASEHASAAVLEFGKLIAEAGFPRGVLNIVTGHGEPCGSTLTAHPSVQRISFTGGTSAAREVVRNSAENFAEVSLELGGKSPFIVFDDADLERAVDGALAGIFGASGQSCVAGSRLYLHEKIADEFIAKFIAAAAKLTVGDPLESQTQIGPLCTAAQVDTIAREIAHAKTEGGEVLCGGEPLPRAGNYFAPTVIACPSQQMKIVDTELFGPVACILRFTDEPQVVALANDTKHGLAAGIYTTNAARAHRLSRALRAGIVWVNTYRIISPIAEFGGFKHSGYGRESGFQAMYDYTRTKTVWMDTT